MINTSRCLVGCSLGDLSTMWYLMTYHPTMSTGMSMGLSSKSANPTTCSERIELRDCVRSRE
jgi:hypothetical protein